MATHRQLEDEWKISLTEDPLLWTTEDLQLAAELGKTLLDRNKELETALRYSQNVNEDQAQEIMYLNKQTTALREVNESRLKIYEQLEISVNDLEIVKHKLGIDYANEKKRTKNLSAMLENMETKNNELLSQIDDLTLQVDLLKKKLGRQAEHTSTPLASPNVSKCFGNGFDRSQLVSPEKPTSQENINSSTPKADKKTDSLQEPPKVVTSEDGTDALEEVTKLLAQLRDVKLMHAKEQRKVAELEEHLDALQQQNQALENQVIKLHHKGDEFKSIHEEISLLEEVRKGQICSRCLSDLDYVDQQSNIGDPEEFEENIPEDDDSSIIKEIMNATPPFISKFDINVDDYKETPTSKPPSASKNFYKEFVDKYEPLFNDQGKKMPAKKLFQSLEEELRNSGEFSSFGQRDQDYESGHDECSSDKQNDSKKSRKNVSRTPTDFSEAETSSSGFADEMSSNYSKSTQTDCILGSLLCSITTGDDCSLGVYNTDNQIQQKSQYLELFKEIFTVLKKAAENKDEVLESSRQLEFNEACTSTTASEAPMSIANSEIPSDDTCSVQSSAISLTFALPHRQELNVEEKSEKKEAEHEKQPETKEPDNKKEAKDKKEPERKKEQEKKPKQEKKGKQEKREKQAKKEEQEKKETKTEIPSSAGPVESLAPVETIAPVEVVPQEPILRPLIRQSFDYINVEHRKRSSSRRKNRNAERSDSPLTLIVGSQPINYTSRPNSGRRRRELKNAQRIATPEPPSEMTWNGNTLQFWATNRANVSSPTPSQTSERGVYEFKPSVASQEIRKLKNLDKSYAEVLKLGETRKREHQQRHRASKGTTQHR